MGHYWLETCQSPSIKSWPGYAFEELCFNHINDDRHLYLFYTSTVCQICGTPFTLSVDILFASPAEAANALASSIL